MTNYKVFSDIETTGGTGVSTLPKVFGWDICQKWKFTWPVGIIIHYFYYLFKFIV